MRRSRESLRGSDARPAAGNCWCLDRGRRKTGADRHGSRRHPGEDGELLASDDPTEAGFAAPDDARGRDRTESGPRRPSKYRSATPKLTLEARQPWRLCPDEKNSSSLATRCKVTRSVVSGQMQLRVKGDRPGAAESG